MANSSEKTPVQAVAPSVQQTYGAAYFADYCGMAYERNEHWMRFFGGVADHIVRDIQPASAFDMGCAKGFLVELLVDRGVDAFGRDISEYAISQVRPDIRDRCEAGSAVEPIGRRYDLITCIELIEHMAAADAQRVINNICAATDDVIFSSTPTGYLEETHVNINPPEHWAELFAQFGFHRDVTYDLSYLAPWAMRFRRARDPLPRLVREYERELWHLRDEAQQRNDVIIRQLAQLEDRSRAVALAESLAQKQEDLGSENDRLSADLEASQRLLLAVVADLKGLRDSGETRAQEQEDLRSENDRLSADLGANQRLLLAAVADLKASRDSRAGKIAETLLRNVERVAPIGTRRRRSLTRAVSGATVLRRQGLPGLQKPIRESNPSSIDTVQEQYDQWRARHEPTWEDLNRMRHEVLAWASRPLVSIIMPTYNPRAEWVQPAIDSVLGQVYENWELCIADDASTEPHIQQVLKQYAASDPRIKVRIREVNGGIAAASASALEMATGEFVGLLDHDDLLRPHALYRAVELLLSDPELDVVYSDEDMLQPGGTFGNPAFKPDWSPHFLLSVNYICHFLVLRREIVERVGGFRDGFDGAQDHDLVLRTTEKARRVGHIPEVLYAWRQVPGSVALAGNAKMYAYEAGQRAVEEALARRGMTGRVGRADDLGRYHARLDIAGQPHVAIVIPTRDRVDLLRACIESIERRSTYPNWSIIIVDNDTVDAQTLAYFEQTRHQVVRKPGHFNYSRLINFGRAHVDAPYMLTVNNDVSVISPGWIEALLEQTQCPEVGVAGGRLLYPNGRVQHEGIGVGNIRGGHIAANLDAAWMGRVIREVSAVTGACQMIKLSVFDEVGGYDEAIHVAFNDVDFCLRVRRAGYLIEYTPHAELFHPESASRGRAIDPVADYAMFWDRWGVEGGIHDPYLSPHVRNLNPLQLRIDRVPGDR